MKKYEIKNKVFDDMHNDVILEEILSNKENYNIIVVGSKLVTIIQDDYTFVVEPMSTNFNITNVSKIGTLNNDIKVYMDPWLKWEDWSVTYLCDINEYKS